MGVRGISSGHGAVRRILKTQPAISSVESRGWLSCQLHVRSSSYVPTGALRTHLNELLELAG